jgi:hypothetical protein
MHERKWFRNVYIEGVGTLGICTDADAPYESRATECVELTGEASTAENDLESASSGSSIIRGVSRFMSLLSVGYAVTSI